jgi:hypothetical protein
MKNTILLHNYNKCFFIKHLFTKARVATADKKKI